jgi:hypothetical protein
MSSINYLPLPHDEMAAIRKKEAEYQARQRQLATESRQKILASMPVASMRAATSVPTTASMPVALTTREKLEQLIESEEAQKNVKGMESCLGALYAARRAQEKGREFKPTRKVGKRFAKLQAEACVLVSAYANLIKKVNETIAMLDNRTDPADCNEKWIDLTKSLKGVEKLSRAALESSLRELALRISLNNLDFVDRILYAIYGKLGWPYKWVC